MVGYINSSGKIVIKPSLPRGNLSEFHEGLLAVPAERGVQYFDTSGSVVFRADVWLALDFSEGMAPAATNGERKWGFLDRSGRFAIPPKYFSVERFSEGLALASVSDGRAG